MGRRAGKPRTVPTVLPFHTFTYAGLTAWHVREICRRNGERVLWNVGVGDWFPGFPERPGRALQRRPRRSLPTHELDRLLRYPYPYPLPPPPAPHIHIGYLSSDFNNHPLAHLMQSVFGLHDRTRFKVYCYSLSPSDASPYRAKIEREADVFLDVGGWSVQQIVERVVADGVHVLCNLNGYTKGGRNEVFAARAAPVQMQFMGFAGTMGSGSVCDPVGNGDAGERGETGQPRKAADVITPRQELVDSLTTMDAVPHTWLDYLLTDEIATPRKFVCGEPIESDEVPWWEGITKRVTDDSTTSSSTTEEERTLTRKSMQTLPVDRGPVVRRDDRNRVYTEACVYMPWSYFVNDHRWGFREEGDAVVEEVCAEFTEGTMDAGEDGDLTSEELGLWRQEQVRRLKMRREMFPWMSEDTVVYANFNQLYKLDPEIYKTWLRILDRVPNAILWLLRFPPPGEQHLLALAHKLYGPHVASRVVFTDVAPKHLHIHRGRIADVFLDTPECNAHTTAADILFSGTPVVTYPRYDFKMCSRVCASVSYATGSWTPGDIKGIKGGVSALEEARAGILLEGVDRLKDPMLLGHWMVVKSYGEYEDVAVRLGREMKWEWMPVSSRGRQTTQPPGVLNSPLYAGYKPPPPPKQPQSYFQPGSTSSRGQGEQQQRTPPRQMYYTHGRTPSSFSPMVISPPAASGYDPSATITSTYTTPTTDLNAHNGSSPTPTKNNMATIAASPFYPTRDPPYTHTTHIFTPVSSTLPTRLRRRIFLNRETCPLFDTPRWVRGLEDACVQALDKWERDFRRVQARNREEVRRGGWVGPRTPFDVDASTDAREDEAEEGDETEVYDATAETGYGSATSAVDAMTLNTGKWRPAHSTPAAIAAASPHTESRRLVEPGGIAPQRRGMWNASRCLWVRDEE
ncbi:glycosyl transferase family 41-domain-containing protein [Fimicolochytrium jonesii]|uniref:glycosyl transferase family 41-domain-containing protein n=1 Tax=Fimicolochytrium jonesii TaxID=1396493 RepID=UPI0022FE91C4|nr:glycosyl transferase family 41-domain-containing protein [Fimicolochytrium jonesii]KAI8816235.1 glycosyl transferase family 41-domain-containing protein [Fimicolochytrium jonesii]